MKFFGERFKKARKELGLTLVALGKTLGVTNGYLSFVENGKREPSETVIKLFCSSYSVNYDWLMTGEGEMFTTQQSGPVEIAEAAAAHALRVGFDPRPLEKWEIANLSLLRDLKQNDPEKFSEAIQEIASLHYEMMRGK